MLYLEDYFCNPIRIITSMRAILTCLLVAVIGLGTVTASAQNARPLRIVVGFAPGGGSDTVTRLMAAEMSKSLGRVVIVDNKAGANGNIAANEVAKASPDGNTLLATFNTHPVLAALYPHLPFDPVGDFRAVVLLAATPYLLVANPAVPGTNLADVLARAQTDGRTLSFATVGSGSPQHLSIERLKATTPVPITVLHYKGGAPAQNDVLAGHVDMMLATVALALPHVKAGKLKVLAVSSAQRLASLPDVPTFIQSGVEGFVSEGWYGFLAPSKTPTDLVRRYNQEVNRALALPRVRTALQAMGAEPLGGTPEEMERRMQGEQRVWTKIIRDNAIKPE